MTAPDNRDREAEQCRADAEEARASVRRLQRAMQDQQTEIERLREALTAARAQGHAAGVREGIDALDERLPHGWMWDLRRYMNHPWAQRGYAKIWAPHIDDPPVEVYARTPGEALQQAIDRALGAPEPQEGKRDGR